ncbi:MAG: type II secretion system protein [Patescibacteria group bacterium]
MRLSEKGVTLIELLIVVGVISIVAAVGGDILLTVVRAYKKAQILGTVEQNGSLASTLMENNLRNSSVIKYEDLGQFVEVSEGQTEYTDYVKITSAQGVSSTIQFVEGGVSGTCPNGRIEVDGVAVTNTDVNSGVNIIKGGSSIFTIYNPEGGPPIVTALFKVTHACQSPVTASAEFNTTVTLRGNYGN